MRQQIRAIDDLVRQALESGQFASREDCISAMLNWLVLNDYVNPSQLCSKASPGRRDESIDDRHANGVSEAEETRLQYEILRDRDA